VGCDSAQAREPAAFRVVWDVAAEDAWLGGPGKTRFGIAGPAVVDWQTLSIGVLACVPFRRLMSPLRGCRQPARSAGEAGIGEMRDGIP
jgi:hypothetical protein